MSDNVTEQEEKIVFQPGITVSVFFFAKTWLNGKRGLDEGELF